MKVGLEIVAFNWPGSPANLATKLAEIARTADEAGFASIWVMDHFFQMDRQDLGMSVEHPMLESYTTLGYLAGVTKRARLGTLVTGVVYRCPGVLIKAVSNLDVLSGGRAYLGIGAAWYQREAVGLGFPFPPLKERFERLEETLQIAKRMWAGDHSPFHGRYSELAEPLNSPQPLSRPHPPIVIGGAGEKKTLRLVAQYGDACNLFAHTGPDEITRKLDVLKRHCEDVGRPYDAIERTALGTVHIASGAMTAREVIATCRSMAKLGIQHMIFNMPNLHEIVPIEVFAREVIPAVGVF
ncbi:MAG TPA: LLM class F420-dependent oxidoreductase [Candidatus Methylomirabilis sp.]